MQGRGGICLPRLYVNPALPKAREPVMMTRKDILGVKTDFGSKEEKNRKEQRQS